MDTSHTHLSAVLGRLFWMIAGPLGLALCIYYIVTSGTGWRTEADLLYFLLLGGMILGRWLEFRGGQPQTTSGEPATMADFRRYVVLVAVAGPIVWVIANVIGNHVLAG